MGKLFASPLSPFFTKADDTDGLQIHKLEALEPDQVKDAATCMQKLRKLTMRVRVGVQTSEKRSHDLALGSSGFSPKDAKNDRTLQQTPTDANLPDNIAQV